MEYTGDLTFQLVFGFVVLVRFVLPFTIFRFPLPGIIACLIVDAVDQTVFQTFGYDPPFYQGYDKAMDVFYLGIAYIATLRNWVSIPAFRVARFLFFYRQIGVVAFELSNVRALLLIFANTFEYFFIAYEAIRSRWSTLRILMAGWLVVAASIWIFVKLPQEYWIHIAQRDFTDTVRDVAWFGPLLVGLAVVALLLVWFVIRPRLPRVDHGWQIVAPALPAAVDTAAKRAAIVARYERVWSAASLEKSMLVGLLSIVFASVLPNADPSYLRMFMWIAIFVLLNIAATLALARRGISSEAIFRSFLARLVGNIALIYALDWLIRDSVTPRATIFFVVLFCVLVTAYDRFRPVYTYRLHHPEASV
jgi:hypothetical protein